MMARFDLTKVYCEYMDPHLTYPLLEFLCAREIYDNREILEFILHTVNKTNMIDYTMDTRKRLNLGEAMPQELVQRKMEVIRTLKRLQNNVAPIMKATELLQSGEITKDSKTFINALQRDFNFTTEHLESAYKLAKYLYECGNYQEANSYLYFCLIVMSPDDANYLNVLWGKLATEILTLNWSAAMEDLTRLRDFIDNANFSPIEALHQRSWLIHWSVLIFFNHAKGRETMIDMFVYKMEYLNAIHTRCPHILRYLAIGVVMNYSPRAVLNDVVKIIEQESYAYRDPITEFLECLLVNFDFEGARFKLQECQQVILNDFFIVGCLHEFVEGARLLIFETYCRIHKTITIAMLAEKLTMSSEEAECWIVNLIRTARLDAKIDSKNGYIIMGTQPQASCQHLMEKVDTLSVRTRNLGEFVERVHKNRNPEQLDAWKYYKDK